MYENYMKAHLLWEDSPAWRIDGRRCSQIPYPGQSMHSNQYIFTLKKLHIKWEMINIFFNGTIRKKLLLTSAALYGALDRPKSSETNATETGYPIFRIWSKIYVVMVIFFVWQVCLIDSTPKQSRFLLCTTYSTGYWQ